MGDTGLHFLSFLCNFRYFCRNEIEYARKQGKFVVVAGCVPQGAPKSSFVQGLSIIGVQQIDRVVEVVEETLKGNTVKLLGTKKENGKKIGGASLLLPKVRRNPLIEIIAINTGCLNQCTYCKTKHARGDLGSYPPEDIVARAVQAFEEGVVEIWLTSEDTVEITDTEIKKVFLKPIYMLKPFVQTDLRESVCEYETNEILSLHVHFTLDFTLQFNFELRKPENCSVLYKMGIFDEELILTMAEVFVIK